MKINEKRYNKFKEDLSINFDILEELYKGIHLYFRCRCKICGSIVDIRIYSLIKCKFCIKEKKKLFRKNKENRKNQKIELKNYFKSKEYYDLRYKTKHEGICLYCGKDTKFIKGKYFTYCSLNCAGKVNRALSGHKFDKSLDKEELLIEKKKIIDEYKKNNPEEKRIELRIHKEKRRELKDKYRKYFTSKCQKINSLLDYKERLENFNCNLLKYGIDIEFKCNKCGNDNKESCQFIEIRTSLGVTPCTHCMAKDRGSAEEKNLINYIKSIYTGLIIENDRKVLNGSELDIYLPELKLAFEFDCLYWHNEVYKKLNYHLDKTNLCLEQGIQLIHIFEDEWLHKQDIVKSRIKSLFGISNKIYARKTICKEIPYLEAKDFLESNHIQSNCISKYRYGLYFENELVSIMTFGKSRFKDEFELLRFCNKLGYNVIGGASKLFSHFLEDYNEILEVISYADRRWSIGNLYDKLGFSLEKITNINYYYVNQGVRYNRIRFQKHKLIKEGFDSNKSEHEIMLERNIYRIYDCGNLKYKYIRNKINV